MHESNNQKPVPLKVLLDDMEKANKDELHVYTLGHLNYKNLYKPQVLIKKNSWSSNLDPIRGSQRRSHIPMPNRLGKKVKFMKKSWADFTIKTSLVSSRKDATPLALGREEYRMKKRRHVSPVSTQFSGFFQETSSEERQQHIKARTEESVLKIELELPEIQLLKFKPVAAGKIGTGDSIAEYHFLPSYLAGLTKHDQFKIMKLFNKEYLKKEDMYEHDLTKNKIVEDHEKKLLKELLKLNDVGPLHVKRLRIFSDCLEDVCNNSVIFGDILHQIKNAYEMYLQVLLDSQPDTECKTFLFQIPSIQNRAVKASDVNKAMEEVKELEQKAKAALENNEQLRKKLQIHMSTSQSSDPEQGLRSHVKVTQFTEQDDTSSLEEQLLLKKYQILALWDEIQELNQEMKENMTLSGDVLSTEESVKNLEVKAWKLQASNKFLERMCQDLDSEIEKVLSKQNVNLGIKDELKYLLNKFLSSEDGK